MIACLTENKKRFTVEALGHGFAWLIDSVVEKCTGRAHDGKQTRTRAGHFDSVLDPVEAKRGEHAPQHLLVCRILNKAADLNGVALHADRNIGREEARIADEFAFEEIEIDRQA